MIGVHLVAAGGPDWTTRGLAILSIVVSTASLTWQAISYRLGGPRLRLKLVKGYLGHGALVSAPASTSAESNAMMTSQGYDEALLGVEVTNVGRLPISIVGVQARTEHGFGFWDPQGAHFPALPHRIEPHSTAAWFVDLPSVIATARVSSSSAAGAPTRVRMVVTPAGGKARSTSESISI